MAKKRTYTTAALLSLTSIMFTIFIIVMGFRQTDESPSEVPEPDEIYLNKTVKIPDEVTFAGERMPLENFDTRESLERELLVSSYRHSSTILIIKRANRYLPIIEKYLAQYNVPTISIPGGG